MAMKCSVCAGEGRGAVRYFIWVKTGDWRPFIGVDTFVEWMARSMMKHRRISADEARREVRSSLHDNHASILNVLRHKAKAEDWKIMYDFVCDDCANKMVA